MNHELNTYLAVTLASTSPFKRSPRTLNLAHPSITHVGPVGALDNVQLVSVPKEVWAEQQEQVLSQLKSAEGVQRVDVQSLKQRSKRDEF
ncbi:hypothetical protein CPB85DRAFT_1221514 [Mucidula mucida]|nr:hypothetical protein CPB85DRAFT_1221514 [Mucidula mucida]